MVTVQIEDMVPAAALQISSQGASLNRPIRSNVVKSTSSSLHSSSDQVEMY